MFNRVISYFDHLYSPTALAENRQPPMGLRPFVGYFIGQFRAAFIIRILLVSIGSIADALMPVFVGLIVGMLATTNPGDIFTSHGQTFLWMIVVVVLVRPLTFLLDTLIRNHAIVPNLVDLVRWQSHWHVIRQSWTFFQNDFAGRVANKIIQAGEAIEIGVNLTIDAAWYALVFVVVAIIVLAQLDPVLLVPIGVWLLLYAVLFSITMPLI
ncbi:MAG: multidrug ABC transporter ATP-binding protein, partial [Devosia sp.]